MNKISEAKKINQCVSEILDLFEKNELSEKEIIDVIKTAEKCLGIHQPPHGMIPEMNPPMPHGPHGFENGKEPPFPPCNQPMKPKPMDFEEMKPPKKL